MAGKRKNYMFSEEPITKYKSTELRKLMADDDEAEQLPIERAIHEMSDQETDSSNGNGSKSLVIDLRKIALIHGLKWRQVLQQPTSGIVNPTNSTLLDDSSFNHHSNADEIQNVGNDIFSHEELYSSTEDITDLQQQFESTSVGLLQEKSFFETVSLNISRSPADILLMTLKFAVSSKLSLTALSNVLKLVNLLCGTTIVPETRYAINQICGTADNVIYHSICPECTNYLGTFEEASELHLCQNCNASVNVKNRSDPCYFAMIDPSEAVVNLLQNHEDYYEYIVKERQHEENRIKDIYDGQLYRNFVNTLSESDRYSYVTSIFNTDGAPVFKSSKFSLWPIYLIINEIPLQNRMDNVITVGLWCGNTKPEMSAVLEIFVTFMNNLSNTGINCTIKNDNRRIQIYPLIACVDTQARAPMNGFSNFNANYGCDWCLEVGEYYAGSMRYPYMYPTPTERDHDSTIQHAANAVSSGRRVFGVVSASPLLNLHKFNIIQGFTPDYMHCCLAGVAKQFTDYILGHLTKTQIDYINVLLKHIRAPNQIGRLSRPLEYKGYWKAREWENWLLYYSVPILSIVMHNNSVILRHWCLIVDALHILLKMDITYTELNDANRMLHKFVEQSQNMYSLKAQTYNVHQLLHLAKSVYNWGPLFCHSTFPFEAGNHKLLTAINCAKGVILQIVKYQNIQQCIRLLEKQVYPDCPKSVIDYCEHLRGPLAKHFHKINNITYLGIEKFIKSEYVQKLHISRKSRAFNKIVFRGSLFMSANKKNKRSCNYFAQLKDNRFIEILSFVIQENDVESTICRVINVKLYKNTNSIFHVLGFSEEVTILTESIFRSCVCIEIEHQRFIVPLPNTLHY